jgi:hypothetical protein
MRIRLLTTAAAIALFAAMTAPGLAMAAGETPSSSTGATTGTSTSTGGSLSEPAGIDSNATTPSVYAPSSGAGSPGAGAGTAGTGVSSSGTLGNSTSPALSPSGISTNASSSNISGSAGTMGSSGTLGTSSNVSGSTVMPTPGMPGTVSTPISGPVGSNAEPGRYIGAPYETSMGGTEHFRRTTRGDLQASNNQSRYDELVQTIRETAGDTRGMADRNTAGPLPQSPFAPSASGGSMESSGSSY